MSALHPPRVRKENLTFFFCWPFVATFCLFLFLLRTQRQIALAGGAGWDGAAYLDMVYGRFTPPPYCLRIGYPLLIRYCSGPLDPLATFGVVSKILASVYSVVSPYILRKIARGSSEVVIFLAWGMLNLSEFSPLRHAFWYPTNSDIPANFLFLFLLGCTLGLTGGAKRNWALAVCLFLGTVTRENFAVNMLLVVSIELFSIENGKLTIRIDRNKLSTLAPCCLAVLLSFLAIKSVSGYWPIAGKNRDAIIYLLEHKLVGLVGSILCVYGVCFLTAIAKSCRKMAEAPSWTSSVSLFLCGTFPIAFAGGQDTTRFLYWYMPLAIVLMLEKLNALYVERRWSDLTVIYSFFLFSHRAFLAIDTKGVMSGCSFRQFIGKTSPSLISYNLLCPEAGLSLFLPAFLLATTFLVWRRVSIVSFLEKS